MRTVFLIMNLFLKLEKGEYDSLNGAVRRIQNEVG